jgi:hypothetical protein
LKPARRNAGISVPVENVPAPIQPIPAGEPEGALETGGSLDGVKLPDGGLALGTLASGRRGAGTAGPVVAGGEPGEGELPDAGPARETMRLGSAGASASGFG